MTNLSLKESKLIGKSRSIKTIKKILSEPKPKTNLSKKKKKEIKKDFNKLKYRFSISKINEFRRGLYNIKKQKNLSALEIKKTEKKSS